MGKLIDLTGKKFERLTVIKYYGNSKWLCRCNCNRKKTIYVSSGDLRNGHTKSCGCLQKERASEAKRKILIGKTFGLLKVISFYGISKNQKAIWLCECKCGNIKPVLSGCLITGDTKSCGCIKDSLISNKLKNYLKNKYKTISEYKIFRNPSTNYFLPFDIFIPKYNIFIEVNGRQHYEFVEFFHRNIKIYKYNKSIDRLKRKYARKNGTYIEVDLRKIKTVKQALKYIKNIMKKYESK